MLTSTRYQIVYPDPNTETDSADVPRDIAQLVTAIEKSTMFSQGTLAARPPFGTSGRWYMATDQTPNQLFYDTGTQWFPIGSVSQQYVDDTAFASALLFS